MLCTIRNMLSEAREIDAAQSRRSPVRSCDDDKKLAFEAMAARGFLRSCTIICESSSFCRCSFKRRSRCSVRSALLLASARCMLRSLSNERTRSRSSPRCRGLVRKSSPPASMAARCACPSPVALTKSTATSAWRDEERSASQTSTLERPLSIMSRTTKLKSCVSEIPSAICVVAASTTS